MNGEIDARIRKLHELGKDLAALAETAAPFGSADCPPESMCRKPNR